MVDTKESYSTWLFFNILLPLTPVLVKMTILIFGNEERPIPNVLDSTELLYYSFVICIITIYDVAIKDKKSLLESWMLLTITVAPVINVVILVMIYLNIHSAPLTKIYSISTAVLIPILASRNKKERW